MRADAACSGLTSRLNWTYGHDRLVAQLRVRLSIGRTAASEWLLRRKAAELAIAVLESRLGPLQHPNCPPRCFDL